MRLLGILTSGRCFKAGTSPGALAAPFFGGLLSFGQPRIFRSLAHGNGAGSGHVFWWPPALFWPVPSGRCFSPSVGRTRSPSPAPGAHDLVVPQWTVPAIFGPLP